MKNGKEKIKVINIWNIKKTFNSIEQAKTKSKNTVVIEKKNSKFLGKSQFTRQNNDTFKTSKITSSKPQNFSRTSPSPNSDFEKRKLAEQRATRRIKGETIKENKPNKISGKRRELKLTISRALSAEHIETKSEAWHL